MTPLPKPKINQREKGQSDHVDAWLMSYADLITLLFMFFVILVTVSASSNKQASVLGPGEPPHPYIEERNGLMALGAPFDQTYASLRGFITAAGMDQEAAIERSDKGVWIDIASAQLFSEGDAAITQEGLVFLQDVARIIAAEAPRNAIIEVAGYTDDAPLKDSAFATSWELAAVRATRVVSAFIDEGVESTRLRAVNYVSERPVVPNLDEAGNAIPENRERNQRIVIRVKNPVAM